MQGQTKLTIFGTVMIVYAIQNGVLSQWPPSPSKCYDDIKAVGNIFCTITGQQGFMNFFWPVHPKVLVILCIDVYLNLSIPFNVTDEEIVKCSPALQQKFDEWMARWSANEDTARKALCDRTKRD
uniref:Putative salivary secreted protein n=1 Tax=Ixodes ricinus TaxID=34613 RepID=A0A6B0UP08_IXORI